MVCWTASDEAGWVGDLDSAAVTVWRLRDADRLEGVELRFLMGDLWVLLEATAGHLDVVIADRRWLREQARQDEARR
ncbi:MAG: hypothetical protein ACRDZ4_24240 [Egibacteraceae bacterium]